MQDTENEAPKCNEPFHFQIHNSQIRPCQSTLHGAHNACLPCITNSIPFLLPSSQTILKQGCLKPLCSKCTTSIKETVRGKPSNFLCPFGWEKQFLRYEKSLKGLSAQKRDRLIPKPGVALPGKQKWHCHECRATFLWRAVLAVEEFEEFAGSEAICAGCREGFERPVRSQKGKGRGFNGGITKEEEGKWTLGSLSCPDGDCEGHVRGYFKSTRELRYHIRDGHGWDPEMQPFASVCLACEGIVWQPRSDMRKSDDLYKFVAGVEDESEEVSQLKLANWLGQVIGHRRLPDKRHIPPEDLTPPNEDDVDGLTLDKTCPTDLESLPHEWQAPRQPGATTTYPPPPPPRTDFTLEELEEIKQIRMEVRRGQKNAC